MKSISTLMLFCLMAFGLTLTLGSCDKTDHLEEGRLEIEAYLADNGLTAEQTPEGVYYIIDQAGTGGHPNLSSKVTVHYEGFLLDGSKFDSSIDRGQAATFNLTGVIEGWQIGIPLFQRGGKGTLLIPSTLAYGSSARPGIPANSVLRFTVQLLDF